MKGHMQDGKFHPHTDYKKGVRKSRDQIAKTQGVKIRKARNSKKLQKEDLKQFNTHSRKLQVYDDGGKSIDRYTVIFDGMAFAMSSRPFHPQGFNQFAGDVPDQIQAGGHLGKRVKPSDLPEEVQNAILDRWNF